MIHNISKKQNNSKMCFVCGIHNEAGLNARFYEINDNEIVALIKPCAHHQGYPGRMHGGIASTILDETIGRAISIGVNENIWGVTLELTVKYKKPVPLDDEIKIVARVVQDNGRSYIGSGEIILPNGDVAVSAEGKYLKLALDKITNGDFADTDWFLLEHENDPKQIRIQRKG
jgi:uncharacterized protein (TIGR00369 family)